MSGIDPSALLGFYQTQLLSNPSSVSATNARVQRALAAQNKGATAKDNPPWNTPTPTNGKQDAKVLSTTNFLDTSKVPLSPGSGTDTKMEQDNQKLFALYSAVNTLAYLSKMAQNSKATSGQLAGLNDRFQKGLKQVQDYLTSTSFNNFKMQAAKPSDNVTAGATVVFGSFTYATKQLTTKAHVNDPLAGLSASDSFTIAIKKGATTSNVTIDLSQVSGGLSLGNVVSYINGQLAAGGFSTRFQKVEKGATATSDKDATYGLQITPGGVEQVSLSAATSTPSLYMVGSTGLATETTTTTNAATSAVTTTPADQKGRLTKLSGIDGSPTSTFSVSQPSTTGTTTAQRTAVDASGNIFVIGTATGDFGSQLNQASQDVYLTKYDSAGNVVWQNLLGSAGTASGYDLALDPSGGVVVTGASTADLTPSSVADGNNDSFVARYDAKGAQSWIRQIQTLATNQANAVSVDASGNIYIGGAVSGGLIGGGQTASGGGDAFLAKYDSKGKLLAEKQFGTSGSDSVAATATAADGSLYVASVQNGHAILSKYAAGDIASSPLWSQDLGTLGAGGAIGGLTAANGKVYVSGATANTNLTGGGATIAAASSGGLDAFVFKATDNGASVTADTITYVGTASSETAGDVSVAADGTVFLTGSTTGTFAGAQRSVQNVSNAFAASISATGSVNWTRQYGGADGVSTGAGLAIDPNGSSVLDALGLPRGTIALNQTIDLTQQTTLRAGDSFKIEVQGNGARTATITIDKDETYDSLATKINAQLGGMGKAKVNYTGGGENMKLQINPGYTINLVAGPKDSDALKRLGISAGVLTAPAKGAAATVTSATNKKITPTYGLGLVGINGQPIDISSRTGANMARSTLLAALSNIQGTYQKTNAPPPIPVGPGNRSGSASQAALNQLSNYNMALGLMGNDAGSAAANIQAIVARGNSGGGDEMSSLLAALGGI
jgi:hypothetical protein